MLHINLRPHTVAFNNLEYLLFAFLSKTLYLGYSLPQRKPQNNYIVAGFRHFQDMFDFSWFNSCFHQFVYIIRWVLSRAAILWLLCPSRFRDLSYFRFRDQARSFTNRQYNLRLKLVLNNKVLHKNYPNVFRNNQIVLKTERQIHKGFFSNHNNGVPLLLFQKITQTVTPSLMLVLGGSKFSSLRTEAYKRGICIFILKDSNTRPNSCYYLTCNEKYYKIYRFFFKVLLNINHCIYQQQQLMNFFK